MGELMDKRMWYLTNITPIRVWWGMKNSRPIDFLWWE